MEKKVVKIRAIDNFLNPDDWKVISEAMLGTNDPRGSAGHVGWVWNPAVTTGTGSEICDELDDWQFTHTIFNQLGYEQSPLFNFIQPIVSDPRLNVRAIQRIKANLNPRHHKIIKHGFHTDVDYECNTAIFYLNTNNGYTEFEDGNKVPSVANRMVIFPSTVRHTGTTCTDTKRRVLINFNYF
tara:strand:- start:726 stop:1274 length:549 start_codon:yes stop_codon:yes gene_type:complete